jgi:NAD(P)-dependent dehydrogenase (short-subunit alcohol dehydrogenase family)
MKVWFVTGASKGFGLALVKQLLQNGTPVAATSRSKAELIKAVGEDKNFLPLEVDLWSEASIGEAITQTVERFGKLDVVMNNAGYGLLGAVEELSEEELMQQFQVNIMAVFRVIKKALPHLRKQGSGHIFTISSVGGYVGFPGGASYNATKFGMTGLAAALAQELAPFGIKVTNIAPGYFRTNFLAEGSLVYAKEKIDAYASIHDGVAQNKEQDGKQMGDPDKAANIFIDLAGRPDAPLHLTLGEDSFDLVKHYIKNLDGELDQWEQVSKSTNFS